MKRIALLLALVLMLCSCAETPPPATTAPPLPTETTAPPETTVPVQTTAPTVSDPFAEYYALLEYTWPDTNWLHNAMGCIFESPAEIDLEYLFYAGFRLGSWEELTGTDELHRARAQKEQSELLRGVLPEIQALDDHGLHLAEHTRFALSAEYRRLEQQRPGMAKALMLHAQGHKALLADRSGE